MDTFNFVCSQYLTDCCVNLKKNHEIVDFLKLQGVSQLPILESYKIGFAHGKSVGDFFTNSLVIPFFNNIDSIVNLAGYSILNHPHKQLHTFNNQGIFNQSQLREYREIILTDNPVTALFLIQHGYKNTTFVFGDYKKYIKFFLENNCQSVISTFTGHQKFLYNLHQNGIIIKQAGVINEQSGEKFLDLMIYKAVPVIFRTIKGVESWPIRKL